MTRTTAITPTHTPALKIPPITAQPFNESASGTSASGRATEAGMERMSGTLAGIVPRWSAVCRPQHLVTSALVLTTLLVASNAEAYRPFDGTDADVAEYGSFELELGPVHWYDRAGDNYLIAPATVLNLGIVERTELVIDFQHYVALGALNGRPRHALLGTDVLVKHVLREGILQGKSGLSVALEAGPLTPEINGTGAFGASADLIVSDRWAWGSVHFNEWPMYSRRHNLDLVSDVILEGPHQWLVRPVAEFFVEKEFNGDRTASGLVGAIWTPRDSFVLDLGARGARIGDQNAAEIRFGFTWAVPVWE